MSRALFIACSPGEIWAAFAEDEALEELRLVRTGAPSRVGEVILGRIVALRPELPAALVDIGAERPGFLDAKDCDRRHGLAGLTEGQAILVEIIKDARDDKAAGLRRFRGTGERAQALEEAARKAKPPFRLESAAPPIVKLLQSFLKPAPDRIAIDERNAFAAARRFLTEHHPALAERLEYYGDAAPLFEQAGLATAIDAVFQPRLALSEGGAITIEATKAATMIDVDGGRAAARAANLAAADAIARQIRLRNLAGPIVIDFIGMKRHADRDQVLARLKAALAADREQPELLGWTKLGHVELVRRRRAAPLTDLLYERMESGGWRKTTLTIALEALRQAQRASRAEPGRAFALAAHPDIVAALRQGEGAAARQELERQLGRALTLKARENLPREGFDLAPAAPI